MWHYSDKSLNDSGSSGTRAIQGGLETSSPLLSQVIEDTNPPGSTGDNIVCPVEGCETVFTGNWNKYSLARHIGTIFEADPTTPIRNSTPGLTQAEREETG